MQEPSPNGAHGLVADLFEAVAGSDQPLHALLERLADGLDCCALVVDRPSEAGPLEVLAVAGAGSSGVRAAGVSRDSALVVEALGGRELLLGRGALEGYPHDPLLRVLGADGVLAGPLRARDGAVRGVLLLARPAGFDLSSGVARVFTLTRDYLGAELERARRQARAGEESAFHRRALSAAAVGTWAWDVEQDKIAWSDGIEAMFGLDPGSFRGRYEDFLDRVHPDDAPLVRARVARVLEHRGEEYLVQYRVVRPDGQVRWQEARGQAYHSEAGSPLRLLGTVTDITARALAEEELRSSEARFRQFFALGTVGMAITSTERGYLAVNDEYCRIVGRRHEDLVGRTWAELTHAEDRAASEDGLQRLLKGELDIFQLEKHLLRPDGTRVPVSLSVRCLRDPGGGARCLLALVQDLTERRRLEELLRERTKMEAVGRLAGGVAHDFNNLLTVILNCAGLLERSPQLTNRDRELVSSIISASERSAALTSRLLAFARRQVLERRVLDVGSLLGGLENLLERLLGERVRLSCEVEQDAWLVRMDPSQLEQVVVNLAVNARDAMGAAGGSLRLSASNRALTEAHPLVRAGALPPGDYLRLRVDDDGQGMDADTLQHAFEPFFTTKPPGEGSGLGLATCHGIVAQAGGHIALESTPGQGTRVRVYLPRHQPAGPADEDAPPRAAAAPLTVLLVEDHQELRRLAQLLLEQLGHRVVCAESPARALELARDTALAVDLLFTDLSLPEMDGWSLSRAVREVRPRVRLLLTSGQPTRAQEPDAVILPKPYSLESLRRALAQALGRR